MTVFLVVDAVIDIILCWILDWMTALLCPTSLGLLGRDFAKTVKELSI